MIWLLQIKTNFFNQGVTQSFSRSYTESYQILSRVPGIGTTDGEARFSRPLPFPSSPPHKKRPPPPGQPYSLILSVLYLIQTKPVAELNQKNIMRYIIIPVEQVAKIVEIIHLTRLVEEIS